MQSACPHHNCMLHRVVNTHPLTALQVDLWNAVKVPGRRRCLAAIYTALAAGASPTRGNANGMTALHIAARLNTHAEAVTAAIAALVAEGADVHAGVAADQATPLHYAATNPSADAAVAAVLALTSASANIRSKTKHGGEPLVRGAAPLC